MPPARDGSSGLALGTLALAALGSAVATFLVGRFGLAGTIVGAALTPVVIALVSELARRPARTISVRPPSARTAATRPPQTDPGAPTRTVYRAERGSSPLQRIRWRHVLAVGGAAFLVVVAGVTLADLASGGSVASGRDTTFFTPRESGRPDRPNEAPRPEEEQPPAPAEVPTETTEEPTTAPTVTEPLPTTTEPPATTTDAGP